MKMDQVTGQARQLLGVAATRIENYGFAIGVRDTGYGHCALGALDWALYKVAPDASQWSDRSKPESWWLAVDTLAKTAGATHSEGTNHAVAEWSNMSYKKRVVETMRDAAKSLV
jgi:hypothetical protein